MMIGAALVRGFMIAVTLFGAFSSSTLADTTAVTDVVVTTENVGTLSVAFGVVEDGYVFRNARGSTSLSVDALTGDTATATIRISWSDTRASRTPYALSLEAGDLISLENAPGRNEPFRISAKQISIVSSGGVVYEVPLPLDTPRTVFTSPDEPASGEQTLDIELQLVVPASSFALTYQTTFTVLVVAGDQTP